MGLGNNNNTHSHNYYNYNYWEVTMYTDCRHGSRQQYRLTWVVPDKGPLNGCVCVCLWMTSYLQTMGRGGLSVPFQRVTSLRRRVQANAPAASYYLCRVPDVGGRRD